MDHSRLHFTVHDLHHRMQGPILELQRLLAAHTFEFDGTKHCFRAFEGLRLPNRQYHLLTVERTTKARPWQSAHQYGLAVDFACRRIDHAGMVIGWFWPDDAPWGELKRLATIAGLTIPISWDKGHVEHPLFAQLKQQLT